MLRCCSRCGYFDLCRFAFIELTSYFNARLRTINRDLVSRYSGYTLQQMSTEYDGKYTCSIVGIQRCQSYLLHHFFFRGPAAQKPRNLSLRNSTPFHKRLGYSTLSFSGLTHASGLMMLGTPCGPLAQADTRNMYLIILINGIMSEYGLYDQFLNARR